MNDELATKHDLSDATQVLRSEMQALGTELRSEMQALGTELRSEMQALGTELRSEMHTMGAMLLGKIEASQRVLLQELKQALNTAVEMFGDQVGVVEEKYQDLPPQVTGLRGEFDDHRRDFSLHRKPPKRQGPSKSRSVTKRSRAAR